MSLNGFLKRLLGLFSNKPACTKLQRSKRYKARYIAWLQQKDCAVLAGSFYKAYHYKKAGIDGNYRVQLVKEQHRHGAVFFHNPAIQADDFSFFFDYLKDQVLQHGYKLRSADIRCLPHPRFKQRIETYYLTPIPVNLPESALCNQQYGNILLDFTSINQHPGYIRLIADGFKDPHFSTPLPFADLLMATLQPQTD
ncbi:MAG TPA: hypothetical protein VIG72_08660 [Pontibacter sp.]